ncbi:MAG: polysaccharide pyruvyl transferase family protein, partial [bacterium]
YVPLMRSCLAQARDRDARPYVLIHEDGDVPLARDIVDGVDTEIEIVTESDARAIKGIIGVASAVISSRFHGLVNALSQGVPALGTGWSHKYEMLFKDYDCEDGVIHVPPQGNGQLNEQLSVLFDGVSRDILAARLCAAAQRQQQMIENMWAEVFSVLSQESATNEH